MNTFFLFSFQPISHNLLMLLVTMRQLLISQIFMKIKNVKRKHECSMHHNNFLITQYIALVLTKHSNEKRLCEKFNACNFNLIFYRTRELNMLVIGRHRNNCTCILKLSIKLCSILSDCCMIFFSI
jgi:hypothetical protein